MIRNPDELIVVQDQLGRLERALQSLRAEVLPHSEERYWLMAEMYVDTIRELRDQVDAYLGLNEAKLRQADIVMGDELARLEASHERTELRGRIREVDLDRRRFILRYRTNEMPELRCEYGVSTEAAVRACLGEMVIVTGTLHTNRKSKTQSMDVETIEADLAVERSNAASDATVPV